MIDADKIRGFWLNRSLKAESLHYDSIGNLEEDPGLLSLKVAREKEKIFSLVSLRDTHDVLDLGAGCGQWSLRFAPSVRSVTAVEYIPAMLDIARGEAVRRGITNIEYVAAEAENYLPEKHFDLVFISGLFLYLDDDSARRVAGNTGRLLKDGGVALLRDATSLLAEAYVIDKYSEELHDNYSAVYRTRDEYLALFPPESFQLRQDGDMFESGSPLNKRSETRLRYYVFSRKALPS